MSSRNRWWPVVALGVLAVVALLIAGSRRHSSFSRPGVLRARPVARATVAAGPRDPAVPLRWMLEPGVPPRRIAGVVLRDGAVAPNVSVSLGSLRATAAKLPQVVVYTDARGHFDFGEQPVAWYRVMARGEPDGYAREVVDLRDPAREPAADQLVLELAPCRQWIWGQVEDAGGGAVVGAQVEQVTRLPGGTWALDHFVTTDAQGHFRLCGGDRYEVTISAEGYGTVRLPRGNPPEGHRVLLVPEAQLGGIVTDEVGAPISEALLLLSERGSKYRTQMGQHAISLADGRFQFRGVEPGRYTIWAESADHYSFDSRSEYFVDLGSVRDDLVIQMRTCARKLAGYVRLGEQPVAGARLSAAGALAFAQITQADGSFVVRCDDGTGFEVVVAGYDVIEPKRIPDGTEPMLDLVILVEQRSEIRGRVTADGNPVSRAVVAIGKDPEAPGPILGESLRADTDPDGSYVLRGVPAGTHRVAAFDPVTQRKSAPIEVTVGERARVSDVDIALPRAARIEGTVRDVRGDPLVGVRVVARPPEPARGDATEAGAAPRSRRDATTRADGGFTIEGLQPGAYLVALSTRFRPERAASWPTVTVEAASVARVELTVAAVALGTIRGRVEYGDGEPVAYAYVDQWQSDTVTDLEGRFTLWNLPPGEHPLRVTANDGGVWNGSARTGEEDLRVVLQRAGRIVGTVGGAGRTWHVRVEAKGVGRWMAEVVDARFELSGIPAGDYSVELFPPGASSDRFSSRAEAAEAHADVEVRPGETTSVHLVAENDRVGAGSIAGSARSFPADQPVGGLTCAAAGRTAATGDDGSFRLEDVNAGNLVVECRTPTGGAVEGPVLLGEARATVEADREVSVTVPMVLVQMGKSGNLGAVLGKLPGASPVSMTFSRVEAAGPAAAAGIRDGDVLASVEGATAVGANAVAAAVYLRSRPPSARVDLVVVRDGEPMAVGLIVGY